ncbi:MAG: hypothetical protein ACLQLG_16810 [Thermoguttaceae bacterium]
MKSIPALIVAAGLGFVGVVLNFFYLSPAAQQRDSVYFIAVKRGATINRGERLKIENLETVAYPRERAASLMGHTVACTRENDFNSVRDLVTCRTLSEGALVWRDDVSTPVQDTVLLGKDEGDVWISVDAKNFIPSLVTPGDTITFVVAAAPPRPNVPTPAARNEAGRGAAPAGEALSPVPDAEAAPPEPVGPTEEIGPFTVLNVGNRLSSAEVFAAAHLQPQQPNVIGLRVKVTDNGMDRLAKKLVDRLYQTNYHTVAVILHSRKEGGR